MQETVSGTWLLRHRIPQPAVPEVKGVLSVQAANHGRYVIYELYIPHVTGHEPQAALNDSLDEADLAGQDPGPTSHEKPGLGCHLRPHGAAKMTRAKG